jgi:hypothetical protein
MKKRRLFFLAVKCQGPIININTLILVDTADTSIYVLTTFIQATWLVSIVCNNLNNMHYNMHYSLMHGSGDSHKRVRSG